jgi:protein-disulfide isomerase
MAGNSTPYSFDSFVDAVNNNFTILLLVGISFIAGFGIGVLYERAEGVGGSRVAQEAPTQAPNAPAEPSGPSEATLAQVPEVTEDDWIRGDEDAPITLIEYSDYDCPFCGRFHDTMKEILAENEGQVRWVYRHFPLDNIHPDAREVAAAAECVGREQGEEAFWNFTDAYFANQGEITAATVAQFAADEVGANAATIESCMEEASIQQKVEDDTQGGSTAGVTGTPGTILVTADGDYDFLPGAVPAAQVQSVIDEYAN